jgi:carboxyl-terminal processing protease
MINFKKTILISLAFLITSALAFGSGFWLHSEMYPTQVHFPVLSEAYQIIQEHGYQDIPEDPAMEYGAIHGMVNAYQDRHTHFLEPVQAELNNDTLSGSYGGIGAQLSRDSQGFIVLHPYPDSPAAQAGLMDGDRLIKVDGIEITPENPVDEVVALVRGPVGKNTLLTITRPPDDVEMQFSVNRADIPLPSVTFHVDVKEPRMGVVRVNVIASSTPDEIQKAVADLQSRGVTHFAFDLRGNGGGLLEEGVDIARMFLKDGIVIQQQYKGKDVDTFEVKKPGSLSDIPMVIFVDSNTASAAEIISGALQQHNRATLIGISTFGKDSIQLVFELQDKSSLHVTSAKWWVPGLQPPVGEGGLQPDIPISTETTQEFDPYLDAAIQYFYDKDK